MGGREREKGKKRVENEPKEPGKQVEEPSLYSVNYPQAHFGRFSYFNAHHSTKCRYKSNGRYLSETISQWPFYVKKSRTPVKIENLTHV